MDINRAIIRGVDLVPWWTGMYQIHEVGAQSDSILTSSLDAIQSEPISGIYHHFVLFYNI